MDLKQKEHEEKLKEMLDNFQMDKVRPRITVCVKVHCIDALKIKSLKGVFRLCTAFLHSSILPRQTLVFY